VISEPDAESHRRQARVVSRRGERELYLFDETGRLRGVGGGIKTLPKLNWRSPEPCVSAPAVRHEESGFAGRPYSLDGWRVDVAKHERAVVGANRRQRRCGADAFCAALADDSLLVAEHFPRLPAGFPRAGTVCDELRGLLTARLDLAARRTFEVSLLRTADLHAASRRRGDRPQRCRLFARVCRGASRCTRGRFSTSHDTPRFSDDRRFGGASARRRRPADDDAWSPDGPFAGDEPRPGG